jgi:RNA polymerase sigma-70 factor (ECF subfamily)
MAEPSSEPGDRQLAQRCIAGDARAWDELVRRHLGLLCRAVRKVLELRSATVEEEDIKDVLQSLFLKLWEDDRRRLRTWQGRSRLSTWLVTVARREALSHLERQRRAGRALFKLASGLAAGNGACPPRLLSDLRGDVLADLEAAETSAQVRDAVSQLPVRDRLLVRLVYFDELSYKEAARALDIPLNSVSPWLVRARRRLAALLRK